jgi:ADP-ribosylation factor related protein 1
MYHLLKGLHAHLTRKDEYSVVIIGLDNVSCAVLVGPIHDAQLTLRLARQ